MRTFLFPPSKPKKGQGPWVVVQDGELLFCPCPGYKWRGTCHHTDEVRAGRVAVATLSSMDKAHVLEALQTHDADYAKAVCRNLYPSISDQEIITLCEILIAAFEDNEESL